MVVSRSSCSTSSENYPISLTHYSLHFNSLRTAEHSAAILLPPATIAKELLHQKRVQAIETRDAIEPRNRGCLVLEAFSSLLVCLFGGGGNSLETSRETTRFDNHTTP